MNPLRMAWPIPSLSLFSLLAIIAVGQYAWPWPRENKAAGYRPSKWTANWTPYSEAGKFGYLDSHGATRIAPQFDGAEGFCDGRARVLVSGRFGFIDTSGSMVIPARFFWATAFRGGYTSVWNGDQWDYLDRQGRAMEAEGLWTRSPSKAL